MSSGSECPEDVCFLSAVRLGQGYRAGRFSPVEVVEAHLSRIGALDADLHAYTQVFHNEARSAAIASAQRHVAAQARGPLDGVPVAVKDLIEIQGLPCAAGSATRRDHIAKRTAPLITRLIEGGAILIGKTHTVEFALGGWGTNTHLGSPRNPWMPESPYTAGGSSSGSAVAVAARLATLAIGTDTGGSVRVPAAFNGLVGLKTTPGQISVEGVIPLSPSLDTVGPIARTVSDAALLYDAMVCQRFSHEGTLTGLKGGVSGMTLARVDQEELDQVDGEISRGYERSLRLFEKMGARIITVKLPRALHDYQRDSEILMAEAYSLYGKVAEDLATQMDPHVRARILTGNIPAREYIMARSRAQRDGRGMLAALEECDALLSPMTRTLPMPLALVDETTTPSTLARFVNQIGFCALAVPNGFSASGLPMSLQIICRPNEEHLVLQIGHAYESSDPFHGRIPPIAASA
ncbi:amidase [Sphingobium sp. SCG-1]|uniref:amidase n=1 Tax=Sphingobium sp. SCG-1 TaxID=2072936 RepID=UPI001670CE44|nr:amidase [Sphingobium sp. SCG-1]